MAVHLIVDGYNLIHASISLHQIAHTDLEQSREELLKLLAEYKHHKQHRITVVFDGWIDGATSEQSHYFSGMRVIFSRKGDQADHVISRLARQEKERAVVVSSDREVAVNARRQGAVSVSSEEFESMLFGAPESEFLPSATSPPTASTMKKGPAKRLPRKKRKAMARLKKL